MSDPEQKMSQPLAVRPGQYHKRSERDGAYDGTANDVNAATVNVNTRSHRAASGIGNCRSHEARVRELLSRWGPPVPDEAGDLTQPNFEHQCEAQLRLR